MGYLRLTILKIIGFIVGHLIGMELHAIAVLAEAENWKWPTTKRIPESGEQGGTFSAVATKLLSLCIIESGKLGGSLLDQFWLQVASCDPQIKTNIEVLESNPGLVPVDQSLPFLFNGVDQSAIDFSPVFNMAAEMFTHLGVAAVMNLGGRKSSQGTPISVSDVISRDTEDLLALAAARGFGVRNEAALKELSSRRDGRSCPLTMADFLDPVDGVLPILAHVIPSSAHGKVDTLKVIAMFAGVETGDIVVQNLNQIGNFMNLQHDAHTAYDSLRWGIEARDDNGMTKYIYRRVPFRPQKGPGYIAFRDGAEIEFGKGSQGATLGKGPHPVLCNLRLAVARVVRMSGAADVISKLIGDADDSDFPYVYLASEDFCDILTAKLLLNSGQAVVAW